MDQERFDEITKALASGASRRTLLRRIGAGIAGLGLLGAGREGQVLLRTRAPSSVPTSLDRARRNAARPARSAPVARKPLLQRSDEQLHL